MTADFATVWQRFNERLALLSPASTLFRTYERALFFEFRHFPCR